MEVVENPGGSIATVTTTPGTDLALFQGRWYVLFSKAGGGMPGPGTPAGVCPLY